MRLRLGVGHLLVLRPRQQARLSHLVHQAQQVKLALDQSGSRALIPAVLGGPFSELGALVFGDGVETVLARLAAGQDISGVRLAGGATAIGFSALAPQQVKGTLDHRLGSLELAQGGGQGRVCTPESLPEFGGIGAQSASLIY